VPVTTPSSSEIGHAARPSGRRCHGWWRDEHGGHAGCRFGRGPSEEQQERREEDATACAGRGQFRRPKQPCRAEQQHRSDNGPIVRARKLDRPADEREWGCADQERPQRSPAEQASPQVAERRDAGDQDIKCERRWPHDSRSKAEQHHQRDVRRCSRMSYGRIERRAKEHARGKKQTRLFGHDTTGRTASNQQIHGARQHLVMVVIV
jgi:hypothetical protein